MTDEKNALAKPSKARETYGDLDRLSAAMKSAGERCNLIAPIVSLDHIPVFHEVSLRVVSIDPESETFPVQGGRALTKTALAKLSQAARISWDAARSGRMDDGTEPYYVHYRAVGYWPDFDGKTVLEISGEKQLDLREGSSMCATMSDKQLVQTRAFILEHAESKARNRAIRQALAIKGKYTAEELQRPFVVPTLVETGRCDDPELRRLYYEKKLEGKGLATRALFGSQPLLKSGDMEVIEVHADPVAPAATKSPPPPVGTVPDDNMDPFGGE